MTLACQWGGGDRLSAFATERVLFREAPMLKEQVWDFTDSLHFLSRSRIFAQGRASWIALFTAVQNGDSAGMTAALHQLQPLMQH